MSPRFLSTPFAHHFVQLSSSERTCELPFAVGGATQQGTAHVEDNQNNQDALIVRLLPNTIIGVVGDGCASTHESLRDTISNNEVGARILGHACARATANLVVQGLSPDDAAFWGLVEDSLLETSRALLDVLVGPQEEQRATAALDFLTTTLLVFVVTPVCYSVYGCGDGVLAVNGKIRVLPTHGAYLSSLLLGAGATHEKGEARPRALACLAKGATHSLNSLFLATDGFADLVNAAEGILLPMLGGLAAHPREGFDFLLKEFRQRILSDSRMEKHPALSNWPRDDASFLLLRRVASAGAATLATESVQQMGDSSDKPHSN
ncbi:MAG: protein phosphatase 2C domain-containing protein [Myxococcota bacterium]